MARFQAQGQGGQGTGTSGHEIEDEGTPLAQQDIMNYTGVGVTASDVGGKTNVDIMGAGDNNVIGPQQISLPAITMYADIDSPAKGIKQREIGTFRQQLKYIGYPNSAEFDPIAYMDWLSPQNWDAGTVKLIAYWTSESPSVASQVADLQVFGMNRDQADVIGAVAFGSGQSIPATLSGLDELQTNISPSLTILGTPVKGAWIQFMIKRQTIGGIDTMDGELQLAGLRLEYTIDTGTSTGT